MCTVHVLHTVQTVQYIHIILKCMKSSYVLPMPKCALTEAYLAVPVRFWPSR